MDHCLWMYNIHYETCAGLKPEFIDDVGNFIEHTTKFDIFKNNGLVRCLCIMVHLYRNVFKPRYFILINHGERDGLNGMFYNSMHVDEYNMLAPHGQIRVEHDRVHEMINDAFGVQSGMEPKQYFNEAPNEEARCFYDQLEESSHPLCEGSLHPALSVVVRLINIKLDRNVPNVSMDSMVDLLGELVNPEFNIPKNFYQAKRSVVQGHIGREIGDFYSYYFGDDVSCRTNRPNRNDEGDIDPLFPLLSIFNQNSRGSKERGKRGFTNIEMQSGVTHILLNCPDIQSYLK
ncbi:hypothetical protein H5410_051499 [Solanum commersonii]|uniref:Uncharacterized protein n=1 Tax=Solanum commersonii TaxID=4109 RepID=A0A9J5X160_SOLCO|nr:hypothetical protein H5410_051499 [Solanum commersonii]